MLRDWSAFHALAKTFAEGRVCLRIAGLTGAARALAVAELLQAHPRPALVLVESATDAHRWTQDLRFFGAPAVEFPGREAAGGRRRARRHLPAPRRRRACGGRRDPRGARRRNRRAFGLRGAHTAARAGRLPGPRAPARGARARRLRAR